LVGAVIFPLGIGLEYIIGVSGLQVALHRALRSKRTGRADVARSAKAQVQAWRWLHIFLCKLERESYESFVDRISPEGHPDDG